MYKEPMERTTEDGLPLVRVWIESKTLSDILVRKTSICRNNKFFWHECYVMVESSDDEFFIYSTKEFEQLYAAVGKAFYVIHCLNEQFPVGSEVSLDWPD